MALPTATRGGTADGPPAATPAYLEVIVNGTPTNLVAAFVERADGTLAIAPDELREVGIVAGKATVGTDGLIDLDRLPGLTYLYDRIARTVTVQASPGRLAPHVYHGRPPATPADIPQLDGGYGGALNYTLFGNFDRSFDPSLSALLDGRVFGREGVLTQSMLAGFDKDGSFDATRLDTAFTHSEPSSLVTWRAGDLISGGLAWTRPVRLLGFQISRDFGLRPDLVTMPVPTFAGTAAVPSTVDVFANGGRIFSTDVKPGPFALSDLPIAAGIGTARVVVTDALGRQTETTLPYFASSDLLAKGLVDFSAEIGLPRLSYGVLSNDYSDDLAGSASLRYGLSDRLTLEAHAEAASGLLNGGVGLVTPLGARGVLAVSSAASLHGTIGAAFSAEAGYSIGSLVLHGRTWRTVGDYADIASVNTLTSGTPASFAGLSRAIDEASVSFPLGDSATAALSFTHVEPANGDTQALLGLSYSRRLSPLMSLFLSGYQSVDGGNNAGLFVGLTRSFADGISATAAATAVDGSAGGSIDLMKSEYPAAGGAGWRLSAGTSGDETNWLAGGSYRTSAAHFAATAYGSNNDIGGNLEVTGAVALEDGGIYLANRIDDAFAVVDAGVPGVTVYVENRPAGRTGSDGKLLVPNLLSNQRNKIAIEPDDLPVNANPTRTEAVAVPARRGGSVVDFAVAFGDDAAIVTLHDASGHALPPGATGELEDGGGFVVGYDSQAYISGLKPKNVVTIALGDGRVCRAEFAFVPTGSPQQAIDGGACL